MAGRSEFKRGKLKELVLYLSEASAEDEGFGMVKLNKLLYRVDFEAFRLLGHSMTGEEYEKQEFGPVARHLLIVLDDLASDGYIVWQRIQAGPYVRKVPAAQAPPDLGQFSLDERAVVERVLNELRRHGGKSVSDWSHEESVGWRITPVGDQIPYDTVVIASGPAPARAVERLRRRVLSGDWA